MLNHLTRIVLSLGAALIIAAPAIAQTGTYTTIDFPDATQTLAWGINNAGDVVGSYTLAGVTHAFKLSGVEFTTIDYPGATSTDARGINDRGDISGIYADTAKVSHGFLLSGGQFTSIDFPEASSTQGWGVSPSGEVVGTYTLGGVSHAFKWNGTDYVTIDPPGSTGPSATGINGLGEISVIGSINGLVHAFLLSGGEFKMFDVPGSTYTNTTAVTARGEMIGRYLVPDGTGYGYLLKDGQFRTIAYPGATLTGSAAMNDSGDIVGRYQNAGSANFHAFFLTGFTPRLRVSAVTHNSDSSPVTDRNPAAAGEVLSLVASGLGATQPGNEAGQAPMEVRVNGKSVAVVKVAGVAGTTDRYQVDFRLPTDVNKGLWVVQLGIGFAVDSSMKVLVQ